LKKKHIVITGKVQGVFYRSSTRDKAQELGVFGFVENKEDGSVYLEAEGDETKLLALMEWCHSGPENAVVEKIKVEEDELIGYTNFVIQ